MVDPTLCQATTDGTWFGAAPTIVGVLLAVFWAVILYLKQPVERLHLRLIGLGCLVLVLSALLGYNGEGGRIGEGIASSLENTPLAGFAFFLLIVAALLSAPLATDWLFVPEITRWRSGRALREAPVRGSVGRYQVRGGFMHDDAAPPVEARVAGPAVLDEPEETPAPAPEPPGRPRIEPIDDELAEAAPPHAEEEAPAAGSPETDADAEADEEEVPWYMRRRTRRVPSADDELAERREEPPAAPVDEALADEGWGTVEDDGDRWEATTTTEEEAPAAAAEADEDWDGTWASEPTGAVESRESGDGTPAAVADERDVETEERVDAAEVAPTETERVEEAEEELPWDASADEGGEDEEDEEEDEGDEGDEGVELADEEAEEEPDELWTNDDEEEEEEEDGDETDEDMEIELAADEGEEESDEDEEEEEEGDDEEVEEESVGLADEQEEAEDEDVDEAEADEEEDAEDDAPARPAIPAEDALYFQAGDLVVSSQRASISFLQRSLGIGYFQAAKLLDRLQNEEVIGPYTGAVNRDVLMTADAWEARKQA